MLTPNARGYDADDVAIIEAISRFRAGGYEEAIGFTVYDTLRYREALEPLVRGGGRVLLDRLAGEGRGRPRGRDHLLGRPAAARADRRDALKAAAGRAAPPPGADRSLNGKAPGRDDRRDRGPRTCAQAATWSTARWSATSIGAAAGCASDSRARAGSSGVSTSIAPTHRDLPPHRVGQCRRESLVLEDGEEDRPQHRYANPAAELLMAFSTPDAEPVSVIGDRGDDRVEHRHDEQPHARCPTMSSGPTSAQVETWPAEATISRHRDVAQHRHEAADLDQRPAADLAHRLRRRRAP